MNPPVSGKKTQQTTGFSPATRFSPFRLILIPLLIYIVWVLDTFLLEGSVGLFIMYQPYFLLLYTVIANIFMGIVVPVFCLRSAFLSGAVNMFQIGFRSRRRMVIAVTITALAGYLLLVTFTSYGTRRTALLGMTASMLPVAIASVMVCWVLIGTHLQAYVRSYGAIVSITTAVPVTGILFGLSFAAHSPPLNEPGMILLATVIGVVSALFFFSVRDLYASAVFVAFALALFLQGQADPVYSTSVSPVVAGTAVLSILSLAGCQWYLSRQFITVRLPADPGTREDY
jgi:hypothetical protein